MKVGRIIANKKSEKGRGNLNVHWFEKATQRVHDISPRILLHRTLQLHHALHLHWFDEVPQSVHAFFLVRYEYLVRHCSKASVIVRTTERHVELHSVVPVSMGVVQLTECGAVNRVWCRQQSVVQST